MTDASHIIMVKIYVIIELEQYDLEADQTASKHHKHVFMLMRQLHASLLSS